MRLKIIGVIILLITVGLSGCTDEEKPNCVVTKVNGYWSDQYGAYFVNVFVQNYGGEGNVHIGCEITQDGQTYNHFGLNTVCAGCETSELIRCGEIKKHGGKVHYRGWVRNT